jgi:hypothetical protein
VKPAGAILRGSTVRSCRPRGNALILPWAPAGAWHALGQVVSFIPASPGRGRTTHGGKGER